MEWRQRNRNKRREGEEKEGVLTVNRVEGVVAEEVVGVSGFIVNVSG